ncbi:hypothetical protein M378DRAFT_71859 [Amanita muscaria Koide BX008]|uniref:Metallo-beta-lactamase domain-containing protein n=1 Tax=Amanita muscaria (strain Koide BX008) TaxID=946122 RepID=A0A0C2XGH9_AMAMK|nr:hypothetical protein M378DRAFT_71859 [Amanita muscaria Koide BX008]
MDNLPSIARLSDNVVRVLGQNPGKFTLQGTNTYIVGRENPYLLIDTGEGRDEYIPLLESAFRDTAQTKNLTHPDVSDIIISHWHHDHVGGLPSVLALLRRRWEERKTGLPYKPPRLHKLLLPESHISTGLSTHDPLPSITASLERDLLTPAPDGTVFHALQDGQHLSVTSAPPLQVLHTPGHTIDSVSIYIPSDRALYTADTVLGQGTAVFEDLSAYLSSLREMLQFVKAQAQGHPEPVVLLYPGHGPVLSNGEDTLNMYIQHRLEREAQIISVLQTAPPADDGAIPGFWTTWTIVKNIYALYPESLWLPAARGIDLHLKKLEADGIVKRVGGVGKDTSWVLTKQTGNV